MTVQSTAKALKRNAVRAMQDEKLQQALAHVRTNFTAKRKAAADKLPEFEALRDQARDIKNHTLANLDLYLERYEARSRRRAVSCISPARRMRRATSFDICRRPAPRP